MSYKKQNWTKYGRQGEIIEIIMRDQTNAKIESFRCNSKQSYNRALKTIWQKYGFKPSLDDEHDDEIDFLNKNQLDLL